MSPSLREALPDDEPAVHALAMTHPWPEYGFYRLFGYDFGSAHLARATGRFMSALPDEKGERGALLARERGEAVGFVAFARQAWESAHFALEMGAIPFLFGPPDARDRARVVDALLSGAEQAARDRDLLHLSLRLDVDDVGGLAAAQRRGWRVVDTLVTWLHDSEGPASSSPMDASFELVTLRKSELPSVPSEDLAPLERFMGSAYRIDRFHADMRLPSERSDALYVAWLRKAFDGSWADGAQTIRRDGRLMGFCSFQHAADVETEFGGPRIIGRGLAGVLPEGKGGYAVLTRMIHTRCPLGSRFQEFDTQIQNFPTVNVWARENMRFVRARVTLHRWLDEA